MDLVQFIGLRAVNTAIKSVITHDNLFMNCDEHKQIELIALAFTASTS